MRLLMVPSIGLLRRSQPSCLMVLKLLLAEPVPSESLILTVRRKSGLSGLSLNSEYKKCLQKQTLFIFILFLVGSFLIAAFHIAFDVLAITFHVSLGISYLFIEFLLKLILCKAVCLKLVLLLLEVVLDFIIE